MTGSITNREKFLNQIASQLGRQSVTEKVERPVWKFQPQKNVLKDASQDELLTILKDQCLNIHTSLYITDKNNLSSVLKDEIEAYGGSVLAGKDNRFKEWGLDFLLKSEIKFEEWDYTQGRENILRAEKAGIGLVVSELTLAESGTIVLFTNKDKGRMVSFLPENLIALIPKSSLVPRMTQAAELMRAEHLKGNPVSSCVQFITGPSNSADIELNLVVGVHGPVRATYIVINDL